MSSFEICYCFPRGDENLSMAYRFLTTYLSYPPAVQHDTVILTDPGNEQIAEDFFATLPNLRVEATPDHAKDLSRYEFWVKKSDASCVMLLGGSSYLHRPGWALRALTAFNKLGSMSLCGVCGHTGQGIVRPHLRSTGLIGSPELLRRYPNWPKDHAGRYACEHHHGCISDWVQEQGGRCWVVNFNSELTLDRANDDPHGYARGSQREVLVGDRLSGPGAPRFTSPW